MPRAILAAAALFALAAVAMMIARGSRSPPVAGRAAVRAGDATDNTQRERHRARAAAAPAAARRPSMRMVDLDTPELAAAGPAIEMPTEAVAARVNGVALTFGQLGASAAGVARVRMTHDELDSRISRAIEVELTFQAARKAGIDVDARQREQLRKLRARHDTAAARAALRWSSVAEDQLEHEARVATAIAVQRELLRAQAADPAALDRDRALFEMEWERWMAALWAAADIHQFEPGDNRAGP